MYDTTGNGHRTALVDEGRFARYLNSGGHANFDWGDDEFVLARTKGGTQHTEDVVALLKSGAEIKFSCKYAGGGIDNHSHTYKNTSKIITRLKKQRSPVVEPILRLERFRDREVRRISSFVKRRENRTQYASAMRAACSATKDNLTTELLAEIFTVSLRHTLAMDYVVIYDGLARTYYWYRPEHHPAINALTESCTISLVPKRAGAESASIVLTNESGQRTDLGLRLRVKHNNGVSDLFEMGTQNSGSFVTTIQQDPGTVRNILEVIDDQGNLGQAAME